MILIRHQVALALFSVVVVSGCEIRPRRDRSDLTATPPPTVAAPAPPPAVAPVAPPVATPAPVAAAPAPVVVVQKPAPVQTVFVQAPPPPVNTAAICRSNFTRDCTLRCNAKLERNASADRRRLVQDVCFAECTRAANKNCN
jgi:hypothetical protein